MGNFYTSITLRGPQQQQVIAALREQGRVAYVSPTADGVTLVCDQETEAQNPDTLTALAATLSRALSAVALAALNHDDDVLALWLYERGELRDEYDSTPGYFDGDEGPPSGAPSGGNAALLCRLFAAPDAEAEVAEILSQPQGLSDDDYLFAVERHADLMDALGLPDFIAGTGYTYLEAGDVDTGDDFTRVE